MFNFMLTLEIADIQVKKTSPKGLKFRCQFRQINETEENDHQTLREVSEGVELKRRWLRNRVTRLPIRQWRTFWEYGEFA